MLTQFLLAFAIIGAIQALPWIPATRPDDWWAERHESFVNNTNAQRDSINVLFYGDSLTEGWLGDGRSIWESEFLPLGVANYGIGGDKVEHILWRVINGEVLGLHPKVIVLKAGINNDREDSSDNVVVGLTALVVELRVRIPGAKILLLGILPKEDDWMGNEWTFTWIKDINIKVSHLADGVNVFWLDMFNSFAASWATIDGSLYQGDKVHLTTAGYQKWADTMRNSFTKLMNV